ncbi:hypothetical protein OIU77_014895 [Salix suchowensis]|uniref:Uncharacterized protein n=1 Tax=Salix suchowensis TaxID=1278906 RepID=A0ABQ8ZZQ2_9ROSI|nr:hypothetical protein OIU77_014895 [Salix suchowensis]
MRGRIGDQEGLYLEGLISSLVGDTKRLKSSNQIPLFSKGLRVFQHVVSDGRCSNFEPESLSPMPRCML